MLRKLEGRFTFLATPTQQLQLQNGVLQVQFFSWNATFVALQVARKIASCNMALKLVPFFISLILFFLYLFVRVRSKVKPSESCQSEVKLPDMWNDNSKLQGK